jgi:uncharacterized membrane protein YphA (DoxX/SURF4 family)
MTQGLAFRMVNKKLVVIALALGVIILILGLFTQAWAAAALGFLLVGVGSGMLLQGIKQRNRDQEIYDDAYSPRSGWRISSN